MIPFSAENLLALAVQAGALVLVGAPLPHLLGVRSPRARLFYWRALLVACLLLPLVQPWVPQPLRPLPTVAGLTEQVTAAPGDREATPDSARSVLALPEVNVLDLVAAGIVVRGAWFAFGLITLGRLRRRATRLDPRPGTIVDAIGMARADAEFRMAPTPTRPVTFGLVRPVVVVPSDFRSFCDQEQKAIACHELIHVRRRDWLRNLGDELVRALAWFHPGAWWLTRQIRLAREQVVDQEVVRHLGARKPYLDALLRLASPDRGSVLVPAPLFLGRSHLSDRIALLLKEVRMSRPRLVLSFAAMAAVLFLTGRAIVVALPLHAGVAEPVVTEQAPPGTQVHGAARPGQMTQPQAPAKPPAAPTKLKDVRPAFPAGSPAVPVLVRARVDSSGAVTETLVVAGPEDLANLAVAAMKQWKFAPGRLNNLYVGFNPAAGGDLGDQPPVLVGGNVRAPVKTHDVKPVYPSEAQTSRVQGVVILETRIAADGTVSDARILRSIPLLDTAALQAVLAWKFVAPGFPVMMTVTVNFVLDGSSHAPGVAGGVPGGVGGGVGGGVPGGVVGGVAGGVEGAQKTVWVDLPGGERALRVGGAIRPPQKVVDVKPIYPKDAQDARVQGVVIIDTAIGPDGKVKDAKILRSVPMLDQAALEAVRQWEFTPTLIHGQPQTVIMTVTVNFTLQ